MPALIAFALWLRDALTYNIRLKSLSLALALGLFGYLHGHEKIVQRSVSVEIITMPQRESTRRVLVTEAPSALKVTLKGSASALDRAIHRGVSPIELDLRDGTRTQVDFPATAAGFRLPAGIEVVAVEPKQVTLQWDDVIERSLPVLPVLTGKPADGLLVSGDPRVEPLAIRVTGPRSRVETLQNLRVVAFELGGITEGQHTRTLAIESTPEVLKYLDPLRATVTVTVTRREAEERFDAEVEVLGIGQAETRPKRVTVTVRGSPEVVAAIRKDHIVPRADVSELKLDLRKDKHGSATVQVNVDIAEAKVSIQPPTVTVKW